MTPKKRYDNKFFSLSLLLLFLDPGSGMGKNQDPGSGINIPDPQHWLYVMTVLYLIPDVTSGSVYEQHLQSLASSLLWSCSRMPRYLLYSRLQCAHLWMPGLRKKMVALLFLFVCAYSYILKGIFRTFLAWFGEANKRFIRVVPYTEWTECKAFSPVVRIGSSRPLTRKRVLPPPFGTRLRERGWGQPIWKKGQTLWYSR